MRLEKTAATSRVFWHRIAMPVLDEALGQRAVVCRAIGARDPRICKRRDNVTNDILAGSAEKWFGALTGLLEQFTGVKDSVYKNADYVIPGWCPVDVKWTEYTTPGCHLPVYDNEELHEDWAYQLMSGPEPEYWDPAGWMMGSEVATYPVEKTPYGLQRRVPSRRLHPFEEMWLRTPRGKGFLKMLRTFGLTEAL